MFSIYVCVYVCVCVCMLYFCFAPASIQLHLTLHIYAPLPVLLFYVYTSKTLQVSTKAPGARVWRVVQTSISYLCRLSISALNYNI